jgi:hypothetical protein
MRGAGALGIVSLRGAGMLGGVVGRHPSIAGGAMAFAIVFSFVATNALWYQPGAHPSPLFRTRDPGSPYAIAGRRAFFRHDASDVTTFRIERPDDDVAAAIAGNAALPADAAPPAASPAPAKSPVAVPKDRPADINSKVATVDPVAAAILNAGKPDKDVKTASVAPKKPQAPDPVATINMVMQIQKGLSNIAYSNVSIDGVVGETTRTAILHFQKHYRLPETGVPDMTVLKKLRDIGAL